MVLKQFLYRTVLGLVPICFNFLNLLLAGNLPPMGSACVIAEDQGRFVLLRRPGGMIVFPGGFIRWREYPAETALREFREETGLEVRLLDTIGIYPAKSDGLNRLSTLTVTFAGEVVDGSMKDNIEGHPCWLDEAEMRVRLPNHYTRMLDDYVAYRERRAQD
ncbi:MAG TPA: NUDIX hydrolase [Ktedonobacteraceae bacterium]|nr:NUDIX hydrolase [Ktedonobacteraceae bacterium]